MLIPRRQKRLDTKSSWGGRVIAPNGSRRIRRTFFFIIACCLFLDAAPTARSQNDERAEYPLKLAFLYNFTKFVEWPRNSSRNASAPLEICVVGKDPFNDELERELQTRTAGGRPVKIKTLQPGESLKECQMVFVPVTEKKKAARVLAGLNGSSALTVGESEGFAGIGGMINLTVEESKLHFEVNPAAAERAGLKISSKLLSLAKIVRDQNHGRKD